ncbi:MAG TPA: AAA family ATPase [Streptosporangiaceae bacterium]|nr:AAA family ATPase [Streptosporangiaceae bacterium]
MRLHHLELEAFGPYVAAQHVDFGLLASSGLFLLEGPTGAGKTTILDAVTFALYGGLAGDQAGEDRLRSHFAPPDAEPRVRLEFSLRGAMYRVTRVPEHQRRKRRGTGFTTEAARVHLERREAGGWVSLSANKAEAGTMISEAIGLTRAQFTQVMLLPQGEFATFLSSGDDERRVLLTRLFGTGLYDRVTAELDQRRARGVRAREDAGAAIRTALAVAAEAAGLGAEARADLLSVRRADRATRLKEIDAELLEAEADAADTLAAATAVSVAAEAADELVKSEATRMNRLTGALERLRGHTGAQDAHDDRAARLAAARRAEPVAPLLAALAETREATRQADEALRALRVPGDLLADPCVAEALGSHGPQPLAIAELADQAAAELEHLVQREQALPAARAELDSLREAASTAAIQLTKLESAREELPGQIDSLETLLAEARSAAAGLDAARQQRDVLAGQRDAAERLASIAPMLEDKRAQAAEAIDTHQRLSDAYLQLMESRLTGMAAELADELAAGQACPVCGSTSHPEPAEAHGALVSGDDLDDAAARRDMAQDERARLEGERDELASEVSAAAALAGGRDCGALDAEAGGLEDRIAQAEQAAEECIGLAADLTDKRAEQERLAEDLTRAAAAAAAAGNRAQQAAAEFDRLAADVRSAASDHPSVSARQDALRGIADEARAIAAAQQTLSSARSAESAACERASKEALRRGFEAPEQAAAAIIPQAELADLDEAVTAWSTTLTELRAAVGAEDLIGLDPAAADEVAAAAGRAAAARAAARQAEQAARERAKALSVQARRFAERAAEVRRAEEAYDRLAEQTENDIRLANLAKGMEGHRRVTLTTYVLRQWFGQVVAAANVRLSAMSSGRYELRRTDEGASRRERAGLTLAVIDRHTGEERSPASLSGGETFYTSLALALGLADVVKAEAGGVDLDTLFIDEGFGSLDAATLDQVMAVIDDLRDRGRVVGIVSHVADLKDRVAERLEVRRLPDGSSAVRIVA